MKPSSFRFILPILFVVASLAVRGAEESQADLKAQARVTQKAAEKIALQKVPSGTIKSAELEKEHGLLIWSFDISVPQSKNITEVQVDAKTGRVISTEIETPQDQAKENAAEKKSK